MYAATTRDEGNVADGRFSAVCYEETMTPWTNIPQFLSSGITMGAIYALVGLGFVTISRASQIINFTQGEFVMLGGVITFSLLKG